MSSATDSVTMKDGLVVTTDHINQSIALIKEKLPQLYQQANATDEEIHKGVVDFLTRPEMAQRNIPPGEYFAQLTAERAQARLQLQGTCGDAVLPVVVDGAVCLYTWATCFPSPASKAVSALAGKLAVGIKDIVQDLLKDIGPAKAAAGAATMPFQAISDAVWHIFHMMQTVNNRIPLISVFDVFFDNMSFFERIVAIAAIGAQIAAAFLSGFALIVMKVAMVTATVISLGEDCVKAFEACKPAPPEPIHRQVVCLGPAGGDDGTPFVADGAILYTEIFSGEVVDSLTVYWHTPPDGHPTAGSKHGGDGGQRSQFPPSAGYLGKITSISGTYGPYDNEESDVITQLTFETDHTKKITFGKGGGTPFCFQINGGDSIMGFFGKSGKFLNQIGVLVKRNS